MTVMELLNIEKFPKMVGVTTTTLKLMHKRGDLIPYHMTKSGTRYYSYEQLKEFSNAPKKRKVNSWLLPSINCSAKRRFTKTDRKC